jgi:proteasome assembly chaperone (PAC2) family protein
VGKVAVDFFIEQLNPQKIAEVYSTYLTLPDGDVGVKVEVNGTYTLPKYELYAHHNKKPSIIFLTGDTQPRPWGQYNVAETILDFVERYGCQRVIALGGYSTPHSQNTVYAISNDLTSINEFANRIQLAQGGMIKGAFGVILGLGKKRGMNCLGLLGATRGSYPDLQSSRNVVQLVADMLELSVDLNVLDRNILKMEAKMKRLQQIQEGISLRNGPKKEKEPPDIYIS